MAFAHTKNNIQLLGNPGAAHTLVFGHGFGTDQRAFYPILSAFGQDYTIVLYDNVGGGQADPAAYDPVRYSSLYAYAADLEALLDELGRKEVFFVGHSMSGMIGLLASTRRPDLFDRLVLLAASPRYLDDPAAHYQGGFNQQALDDLYEAMRLNYQAWASGFSTLVAANPDQPELAASFAASLSALRPDIALQVARVIFQSDYRKELGKVTRPALVVQSQNDIAVPMSVGAYLHEQLKGSSHMVIDAYGHLPHQSAPEAVIAAIRSFIN